MSTRERILIAAERLLGTGRPDFSMRELAAEAGVSFATPFNQFGSKLAIMQAMSAALIAEMHRRFAAAPPPADAPGRVLAAVGVAAGVMLEQPAVNRAVMGAIGAPAAEPGTVLAASRALWAAAIGAGAGLAAPAYAATVLPDQLAFGFRGVLSFWTAGELTDADLPVQARKAAAAVLLGFVVPERRDALMAILAGAPD
ncbi:TetR/AcrR family transcriptional regulator [Tistrella mobilis]|uniref:Short chain dehydrogenase n=1 Tax=Tistrella mobilis (strain KA081020-065) TaxID=1110502 RepID=I3TNN8_TISMK|nr:TetR/AcrR family transcriptional regulator [Tistrella mobilis]AFK54376.1 short chain dehydrogenase [Tistrella mobilis KA081020-065]